MAKGGSDIDHNENINNPILNHHTAQPKYGDFVLYTGQRFAGDALSP
jgi:hypothetical protein